MHPDIPLTEKYERTGWPSLARPDLKPPPGWNLSLLAGVNRIRNHRLSPDGARIAFIWDKNDLSDIYLMPSAGGWPARICTERGLTAYWDDETPQWSPNGAWLAFTLHGHVHVTPAQGGLPRKISDFGEAAGSPVWLPDGRGLIVSVERHDADQLLLSDRDGAWPRPLTDDPTGDHWDAQPSPTGRFLAYDFRPFDDLNRRDVRLIDLESGQERTLVGQAGERNIAPRWSPDGRLLAFTSERSGFNEIWLVQPDGEGLRQLTRVGHDCADLAWSPDGTRLACTVNRAGAFELALVSVNSGQVETLRSEQGYHARPQWSPDGAFITFEYENPTQPPDLYRLETATGSVTQLTFSHLPALAANGLVMPEQVSYRSYDGLEIPAFLFRPARPNRAAVLYPHGGPSSQYVYEWDIFPQYLVAKGYTLLAPNYRGSTGYGLAFEHANYGDWGGGDSQDCLHGARLLAGLPEIDPGRIAIFGGSYGGYMTACCLSHDPDYLFACGVSKYGDANLISSWAQCNRHLRLYSQVFLGHPALHRGVYRAGSPIFEVENVQKPVLILHGLEDDVVPPEASEEWVEALRRAGKTFEYKTYAGEPHGFLMRRTQLDAYARIERFLDWHLLP
ncbi:MAG: S9 family peptidase [Caldilineales bacterium]|nr:S9 family peptidase [Caldilineales bacterium]